jgi:hypothetical protein
MNAPRRKTIAAAIALTLAAGSAHAVLERVGPNGTKSSQGGYPTWYQDTTGLALEFCDPQNAAEVEGGWCLLLPPDVPVVPEVFPTSFFDEHFYYAAGANLTTANGGKALLVLAVEAAFAADVAPGGQITFSRIRFKLTGAPVTGTYRFIHPYGIDEVFAEAGAKAQGASIFVTDDVGIGCPPGTFDCALGSRLGPYLLPSDTPGGAELPAISGPVPGKLYIADPARLGPVTGSALPDFVDSTGATRSHNIFRIEGPAGSNLGGAGVDFIETTDFSLMGRIFTGTMAGRIDVQRANYASDSNGLQLDVFAEAFPTTQPRLPTQPRPPFAEPQLSFFDAPCIPTLDQNGSPHPPYSAPSGANEVQMFAAGSKQWGQTRPAILPPSVCVKDGSARDAAGQLVPTFAPQSVSDIVTITDASFDPNTGTLNVAAKSSDTSSQPTLSVSFNNYLGDMVSGQHAVNGLVAPPSKVRVLSSLSGMGEAAVQVGLANLAPPPASPMAMNDSWTFNEDSGPQTLDVLGNDSNVADATVTIASAPRLGTATIDPASGKVVYTPNPNANGTDGFTYTATVGAKTSNIATVTLNIVPVNDVPTAVNDNVNGFVNVPLAINVIANDTDPDGAADIVGVDSVTQPVDSVTLLPSGSVTAAGGIVTFTAAATGTYSFTYRAKDQAGATSANAATVTVTVAALETLNFVRAEYTNSKSRLRAEGTINPAANQAIKVEFMNGTTVLGLAGTPVTDVAGAWALDTVIALPRGTTSLKATPPNGGLAKTLNLKFK